MSDPTTIQDLTDGIPIAMLTTRGAAGLCGRPLAVQRVDDDGTIWFLVDRHADWLDPTAVEANVAFVDDTTWVSVAGQPTVVLDPAVIEDLGDPVTATWFAEDAEPAALKVEVDHADWWSAPGRLRQVLELAGAKVAHRQPDMGDRGVVEG